MSTLSYAPPCLTSAIAISCIDPFPTKVPGVAYRVLVLSYHSSYCVIACFIATQYLSSSLNSSLGDHGEQCLEDRQVWLYDGQVLDLHAAYRTQAQPKHVPSRLKV